MVVSERPAEPDAQGLLWEFFEAAAESAWWEQTALGQTERLRSSLVASRIATAAVTTAGTECDGLTT